MKKPYSPAVVARRNRYRSIIFNDTLLRKVIFYCQFSIVNCLLLLTGCAREDNPAPPADGSLHVELTIPGSKISTLAVTEPLPGESRINNVYLLFYDRDGANSLLPAGFYQAGELSANGGWSAVITNFNISIGRGKPYDVYVLANLPYSAAAPTHLTTKGELLSLAEEQIARTQEAPGISFSGKAAYTSGSGGVLHVDLRRTVARIDIKTFLPTDGTWSVERVELRNVPRKGAYIEGQTPAGNTRDTIGLFAVSADSVYRGYTYDNAAGNPAEVYVRLRDANGQVFESKFPVSGAETGLERNRIYETGAFFPGLYEHPAANAYIVKPGGKACYIPVSQANLAFPGSIAAGDALTAELLWSDVKGARTGKGLAEDAAVQAVALQGTGQQSTLMVASGSIAGNALVAVKKAGVVVWSWHIWVTAEDPAADAGTVTGTTFMNRNLGAIYDGDGGNHAHTRANGMYYQWGRKDPLPFRPVSPVNNALPLDIYNAAGGAIQIANVPANQTRDFARKNPDRYIFNLSTATWCSDNDPNAWGGVSGAKTAHDPCPPGWRVPLKTDLDKWSGFTTTTGGYNLPSFGFFPAAGYVYKEYVYRPLDFSRSANQDSETYAIYFHFGYGTTRDNGWKSDSHVIRCVKE